MEAWGVGEGVLPVCLDWFCCSIEAGRAQMGSCCLFFVLIQAADDENLQQTQQQQQQQQHKKRTTSSSPPCLQALDM